MSTPSLFDPNDLPFEPPAQRHSRTSVEAAEAILSIAATLRAKVLKAVVAAGEHGLTDEEGQMLLRMAGNTYRPRRIECCDVGLIVDSGRDRPTASGRNAVVWVGRQFNGAFGRGTQGQP